MALGEIVLNNTVGYHPAVSQNDINYNEDKK